MTRHGDPFPSPTRGLLAGLLITLAAVIVYSTYTIQRIGVVRQLQQAVVDRNRRDSLQLLRIQDNLNTLGLAMRDMLDGSEPYPLRAWEQQFARMRRDLDDAIRIESQLSPGRSPEQNQYLQRSLTQFWNAVDRIFDEARGGRDDEARRLIRDSLQSRRDALANTVARLLVRNNEAEQEAAAQITSIYERAERNAYLFLTGMLATILVTSVLLIASNRRLFRRITELSLQRSELSRGLIATQEDTLRHVSRELHDEFGQILTAIGAMLRRVEKRDPAIAPELVELREVAQEALEKVRSLSQSLQPVILQEEGLLAALDWYLPLVERQTGVAVRYRRPADDLPLGGETATHIFRVIQEALNNVVRHSGSEEAQVRISRTAAGLVVEVEDAGKGMEGSRPGRGVGLVGMRERAALIGGSLELLPGATGGTLVRLTAPPEALDGRPPL